MSKSVRDQVVRTMREFGLELKGRVRTYQKFQCRALPQGFRVPDFVKFTGDGVMQNAAG
jgi:hypothetical protein